MDTEETLRRLVAEHKPNALVIVSMQHLASSLLDTYGRLNRVSLEREITTLDLAARCLAFHSGVNSDELLAAKRSIMELGRQLVT